MGELSRTYRHQACGGETTVSGQVLRALATPLLPPSLTECAACGKTDLVNKFVWTHTDENIDQAQDRIRRGLPPALRFTTSVWPSAFALLAGIGIGVGIGVWDRWWTGLLAGFGAVIVLAGISQGVGHLCARFYGIEFERLL